MYRVFLDSEQRALLIEACRATDAFLAARLERADPEGVITESRRLQSAKLASVLRQLEEPFPDDFEQLPLHVKDAAFQLMSVFLQAGDFRHSLPTLERLFGLLTAPTALSEPSSPEPHHADDA